MAVVRVWLLGSVEHGIYPPQTTINYLAELLSKYDGSADMDLVWGPDLSCIELKGDGEPNIVCGPGLRILRNGNVVTIEKDE